MNKESRLPVAIFLLLFVIGMAAAMALLFVGGSAVAGQGVKGSTGEIQYEEPIRTEPHDPLDGPMDAERHVDDYEGREDPYGPIRPKGYPEGIDYEAPRDEAPYRYETDPEL